MTEILVATDLHGSLARAKDLVQAIEREKPALFVFLGDLNYNGARNPLTDGYSPREVTALIKELNTPSVFVKGNCDSEVDETVIGKPFPESRIANPCSFSVTKKRKSRVFTRHKKVCLLDFRLSVSPIFQDCSSRITTSQSLRCIRSCL